MVIQYFTSVVKNLKKIEKEALLEVIKDAKEDTDLFVPHDTGATRFQDTIIKANKNQIVYSNEYIEFIYFGVGLNFQTLKNPGAGAKWIEKSERKNAKYWDEKFADIVLTAF